jgi:hypothetical protein
MTFLPLLDPSLVAIGIPTGFEEYFDNPRPLFLLLVDDAEVSMLASSVYAVEKANPAPRRGDDDNDDDVDAVDEERGASLFDLATASDGDTALANETAIAAATLACTIRGIRGRIGKPEVIITDGDSSFEV